jgi:polar amino acid transport system substrate-binding protein
MKHILSGICLGLLWLMSLVPALAADSLQNIQQRGELIVAFSDKSAPFFLQDKQGNWFGIDHQVVLDLSHWLGVKPVFIQKAYPDDIVTAVANGEADIGIAELSRTLKRAEKVQFTDSYFEMPLYVIVDRIRFVDDILQEDVMEMINQPTVRLGVLKGTSYVNRAVRYAPDAQHIVISDFNNLPRDFAEQQLDAVLLNEADVKNWQYAYPGSSIKLKPIPFDDKADAIVMAVDLDNDHLVKWLNVYIELAKRAGLFERLEQQYLDGDSWRQRAVNVE